VILDPQTSDRIARDTAILHELHQKNRIAGVDVLEELLSPGTDEDERDDFREQTKEAALLQKQELAIELADLLIQMFNNDGEDEQTKPLIEKFHKLAPKYRAVSKWVAVS
jgi:hypothetical protein